MTSEVKKELDKYIKEVQDNLIKPIENLMKALEEKLILIANQENILIKEADSLKQRHSIISDNLDRVFPMIEKIEKNNQHFWIQLDSCLNEAVQQGIENFLSRYKVNINISSDEGNKNV